jgi:hypothetical protein
MAHRRTQSEIFLQYAIRATRTRLRATWLAGSLAIIAAAVLAGLAAMVLADHLVAGGLSNAYRLAGRWGTLLVAVGLGVWLIALPLARRLNDLYVVRLIERAHPEFRNDLTAALQLRADGQTHPGILAAVESQAERDLRAADIDAAIRPRRLRAALAALAVIVAVLLVYTWLSPKSAWQSAARALGSNAPAPTLAQILSVEPPDGLRVTVGMAVDFRVVVRNADLAIVEISRNAGTDWLADDRLTMNLASGQNGSSSLSFERRWQAGATGVGTMLFRVRAGDAVSEARQLVVLPEPALTALRLSVQWPDYAGGAVQDVAGRHVRALAGSTLYVSAEANVPAARASLIFQNSGAREMQVDPADPRRMAGQVPIERDDSFVVRFFDRDERPNADQAECRIELIADAPPLVVRSFPVEDRVELAVNDTLRLSGEASDDFGLAGVRLELQGPGQAAREEPIEEFPPPGRPTAAIERQIPVSRLGSPGDEVRCTLAARDFAPQGQVGRGAVLTVVIVAADPRLDGQSPGSAGESEGEGPSTGGDPADELREMARRDRPLLEQLGERLGEPLPPEPGEPGEQAGEGGPGSPQPGESGQGAGPGAGQDDGQSAQPGGDGGDSGGSGESPAQRPGDQTDPPAGDEQSGSADQRGPVDVEAPETPSAIDDPQLSAIGRMMNEARKESRKDEIDPALLADLGMTPRQFRDFVEQYVERFDQLRWRDRPVGPPGTGIDTAQRAGSDEVRTGEGSGGAITAGPPAAPTESAALAPARSERVSPTYRQIVEAYFRAVSEGSPQSESQP